MRQSVEQASKGLLGAVTQSPCGHPGEEEKGCAKTLSLFPFFDHFPTPAFPFPLPIDLMLPY